MFRYLSRLVVRGWILPGEKRYSFMGGRLLETNSGRWWEWLKGSSLVIMLRSYKKVNDTKIIILSE